MMRKIFGSILVLAIVGAVIFFGFAPRWAEESMNKIDGQPLIEVSDEAKALHATLTIIDLHSDTLMWNRDVTQAGSRGHMDLPRLQQGNVALQVFSSVTKTPKNQNYDSNSAESDNITLLTIAQMQPIKTWHSLLQRSVWHAQKLAKAEGESGGELIGVRSSADVDGLLGQRKVKGPQYVGALLSVEGLHDLEGDIDNLDALYEHGFRMAGFTHFFDNALAGSMHGEKKSGLTEMGREAVRRMERKGMIVDIAHCSHQCVAEILAMARRPVVSSHGGVQATCKVNRNLTDDEIRGVARTGGVIGVGYWEGAVCSTDPRATAKAMKHIRDLVGIETVALGSDYDGATTVRFDTSQLVQVTQALMDEGFTADEIRAAMGGNALRVISRGLQPMVEGDAVLPEDRPGQQDAAS
ncbi:Microsomal dipeptidase [Altererythrobacter epoxidivorans]|uniref:Microsomal dipeptidase n=2 Tax=Altererythrobacter epoxidivorans TaxID=361183 RepID=A0A0M4LXH5_9SPHN|nr:Microsomal dipeptidase [Altererythrobacter epoxidivorans]